jgi:hypothetical protein
MKQLANKRDEGKNRTGHSLCERRIGIDAMVRKMPDMGECEKD